MRKKTAIFLAFALCVSLMTGCGKNEEQQQQQQQRAAADADSAEESVQTEENLRYRSQYYEVNDSRLTSALQNGAADGDDLYFTALGVIDDQTPEGVTPEWEEQYWVYGPILCRLGGDGSVERIGCVPETEAAEGEHDSILFEKLCIGQDGTIWLLEKHMLTKLPAGEEAEAAEAGT
ncbi:MAG: hypothetical protein ABTB30_15690, partial [Clostridia bacterium]